ncbi:MAG TPA: hypothetical protein PLU75_07195 [Oscillospiraceae bacterium]|nr:hypothetical protein [Oscillospiraceae bacterium]HRW57007.1 hypothetical protein [Oscillospiraceae bacterium]
MKATFNDFITQNPNCSKFLGNANAMLIFESLSSDNGIIQMIEASDAGKPALSPLAKHLEDILLDIKNPSISFDDNFTKQAVGLMIKCILEPFGYVVCKQKNLPKSAESKKFQSASVYRHDPSKNATMRVVKHIEEIDSSTPESKVHHD